MIPQPFSDEARAQRRQLYESCKAEVVSLPSVEVDFSAREEPEPIGDNEPAMTQQTDIYRERLGRQ